MILETYLSLLAFQGCKIFKQDFKNLKMRDIKSPEDIPSIISHLETKEFLRNNKFWWKRVEKDYKHCKKSSYKITWPGQSDYPENFFIYFECPPILTYIGESNLHKKYVPITFVGSRNSDQSTLNWMDFYMPQIIKDKNVCVVSGGARGVDQKAHSVALRSRFPTVCFVPSGLDHIYPLSLYKLKSEILDKGGALFSCFSPYQNMYKSFFHIRNQLMACYSKLVVILQAQIRSGTMLTAKKALHFGVPVATLPGPVLSQKFTGNLQLLYDGAFLVRDHIDMTLLIESSSYENSIHPSDVNAL